MIARAKAPVRISFGTCGDTDYYIKLIGWGNGINATLNLYSYCEVHKRDDSKIVLRSLETGQVLVYDSLDEIGFERRELNLMKAVVKHYGNAGIEVITHTDAPLESGLGGSAAHAVSMIKAFDQFNGVSRSYEDTAKLAYHLERVVLGIEGGYQDQWASAYGGMNYMEFTKGGIKLNPIRVNGGDLEFLEKSLLLVFVPREREGSAVHFDQRIKGEESVHILQMKRENVLRLKEALESRRFEDIGNILHFDWKIKKQLAPGISNKRIDEIYKTAMISGALGGRFIGAGTGGSAIFFCPYKKQEVLTSLESLGLKEIKFRFERLNNKEENEVSKSVEILNTKLVKGTLIETFVEHQKMIEDMMESNSDTIISVANEIIKCYKNGGKTLIFGNGGSAADAQHFSAELEGKFKVDRDPLPSLIPSNISALTAVSNDYTYDDSFLRFVKANAKPGDVVIGITTSGNSRNVIKAIEEANRTGALTIGFTGSTGGKLKDHVKILLNIPSGETSIIQEGHLVSYHRVCDLVERSLFG